MKEFITKNHNLLIFSLIIGLGVYLRFTNLTFNSFWLDELFSIDFSHPTRSFSEMLRLTLEDVHPPLYQFLLWIWLKLWGVSEFNARILSAIIGVFTILVSYFFAKEFYNKKISLAVSFIFSTNIFLIFFSQETRSYQLITLLAMLSYMFFYKAIIYENKKYLYIYWIVTIICMYTHYFSFFIIGTQIVFSIIYLLFFSQNKLYLIKTQIKTAVLFFISIVPLLPYILAVTEGDKFWWIPKPSPLYFLDYIHFYFGYGGLYVVFFTFLLTIHYVLTNDIEKKEKIFLIMLFIWISFGYLLPYLKSIIGSPLVQARYTIAIIPPIILLCIYGISKYKSWVQLIFLLAFTIFTGKVLFIDHHNSIYKQQYREALLYVSNNHKNLPIYELIPENGHSGNNTNHFQVYSNMLNLNLNIIDDTKFKIEKNENKLPDCFWLVYSFYHPALKSIDNVLKMYKVDESSNLNIIYKKRYHGAGATLVSKPWNQEECKQLVFK